MPTTPPVPYRSSRWPARFLIATGVIHTVAGFLMDRVRIPFIQAIQAGYINQFSLSIQRRHSFWFLIAGINMMMMGRLMDWYLFPKPLNIGGVAKDDPIHNKRENRVLRRQQGRNNVRSDRKLPREVGYWLVGTAVIGATAITKSGFYLLGLQGLAIILAE